MENNSSIITSAWLEGTNDFQQRIPNPTQYGIAKTVEQLRMPNNGDLLNQFNYQLTNTIGYSIINAMRWENPFDTFRRANLPWGNSIREIMLHWMKAHTYSDDSKQLLDVFKPDFEEWFYSVNYATKYPYDLNRPELLRAMSAPDGSTAINDLYVAASVTALNSDAIDMANTCIELFAEADKRFDNGLFRYQVNDSDDPKESAMRLLEAVRMFVYRLPWPSTQYNSIDVPVFARENELVIFVTPETRASIDVRAYAELFNMDVAEIKNRIMVIPEIPIPNAKAVLTTDNFIHWHDTVFGIYPFFNPDTLNDKFILHHQAIVAPNPSVPCIVLTSDLGSKMFTITMQPSKLTLTPDSTSIVMGGTVALNPNLAGSVTENNDGITVLPDSATYAVSVNNDRSLNRNTFVDQFGVLHLQKSGLVAGDTITVTATSTYINPTGVTETYTANTSLTVADAELPADTYTVTYQVDGDTTYKVPSDVTVPGDVVADKGATITLAQPLKTTWVTSDGTDSGAPGTWAFTGWGSSSGGTPTITQVSNVAANTTVYGKFAFTPTE